MKKKKSKRIVKGTSLLTVTDTRAQKVAQAKIDKCLTCKKPARECKGSCE